MPLVRTSIEFDGEETESDVRRARQVARTFTLRDGSEWADRRRAIPCHFYDIESFWDDLAPLHALRDIAALRPLRTVDAGRRALDEILAHRVDPGLRLDAFMPSDPTASGRLRPEMFAVAASRPGVRHSEAIVSGHRSLCGFAGAGKDARPHIIYEFTVDAVYVVPKARRSGLAAALGYAVVQQIDLDLCHLARAKDEAPGVLVSVGLYAEIVSDGGEAWVDKIKDFLRPVARMRLGPDVEVTIDAGW